MKIRISLENLPGASAAVLDRIARSEARRAPDCPLAWWLQAAARSSVLVVDLANVANLPKLCMRAEALRDCLAAVAGERWPAARAVLDHLAAQLENAAREAGEGGVLDRRRAIMAELQADG